MRESESQIDQLLEAFQDACEAVVVEGDSQLSRTTKVRAVLRNELRAKLLGDERAMNDVADWLERLEPTVAAMKARAALAESRLAKLAAALEASWHGPTNTGRVSVAVGLNPPDGGSLWGSIESRFGGYLSNCRQAGDSPLAAPCAALDALPEPSHTTSLTEPRS